MSKDTKLISSSDPYRLIDCLYPNYTPILYPKRPRAYVLLINDTMLCYIRLLCSLVLWGLLRCKILLHIGMTLRWNSKCPCCSGCWRWVRPLPGIHWSYRERNFRVSTGLDRTYMTQWLTINYLTWNTDFPSAFWSSRIKFFT